MTSSQAQKTLDGKPAIPLRNARFSFNTFSMSTSFYLEIFQSWASILWHMCLQLWCQTLLSILLLSTPSLQATTSPNKNMFFSKYSFSVVQLRNLGHREKECQTRNSAVSSSKLYTYLLSCQVDIRRLCQRVLFSVKHVFFQLFFKSIPVNNRDLLIQDSWPYWLVTVSIPKVWKVGNSESSAYWLGPSSSWVSESSSRVRKKLRRIPSYWGRLPISVSIVILKI